MAAGDKAPTHNDLLAYLLTPASSGNAQKVLAVTLVDTAGAGVTVGSGGLTDTQLRATPVPVSGTGLTDTQLRATAVPVSNTALEAATHLEDAAAVTADRGVAALAVRHDADTSSVDTDGDYSLVHVDSLGRVKVRNIKDAQVVGGSLGIANGASLSSTGGDASGAITVTGKALVGLQMPSAWTAANLTFSGSMDGGATYNDLYDEVGTERSVVAAASRSITLDPAKFLGLTHIKVRSGTTGTPVNQGAARTIIYTTIAL